MLAAVNTISVLPDKQHMLAAVSSKHYVHVFWLLKYKSYYERHSVYAQADNLVHGCSILIYCMVYTHGVQSADLQSSLLPAIGPCSMASGAENSIQDCK